MRYALVNPNWNFDGSAYFGCRECHFPLELGYSKALLGEAGFDSIIIDAHMEGLSLAEVRLRVEAFSPDFIVVTTAPSYLFWRCPPPELKIPMELMEALEGIKGQRIVMGPHGSVTPAAVMKKLGADIVIIGEGESVLPDIGRNAGDFGKVPSICVNRNGVAEIQGRPAASDMASLPALKWGAEYISRHSHHHHRFATRPEGLGAEVEASRGCPYSCTFCAKDSFRTNYRKRPLEAVLEELDCLCANGVGYVYFIDEIFMPDRALLDALASRKLSFGIQTRIDLWKPGMLSLLGEAGCVSIEAGVESISERGRSLLGKRCAASTEELVALLSAARKSVPFVQATLLDSRVDDPLAVEAWRSMLLDHGVWANSPVPMFPYPGSGEYTKRWGRPDDYAWERAHEHYLEVNGSFSDIQSSNPVPLRELEKR
ncbi:Anaerobic magnesium-protoporphyrin IX monomethyl ester cyclase [uncultured bacterium]|nr:Anaerobic magnesium-protoporphyrin IX monomethyl ester cyclase [uncultured bacterium]